ncbi:MAG: hypothetical protein IID48_10655 [Proteobacteria bacterium]|nr:hypothetical protein [Pseudomonadota bacterium]
MADDREGSGGDSGASELDELTHAELLMLYQDSTVSVRFARERQWKLVGAALLLFAAIVAIPEMLDISPFGAKGLALAGFLIGASAIYVLVVYQVWQNAELRRMATIGGRFSNTFAELGGHNAAREGTLHGYIILFFMIATIGLGNTAVVLLLSRFYL